MSERGYAELIKDARYCSISGDCAFCNRKGRAENWRLCQDGLLKDTADAIEELLAKDANVPNKWISVEEEGLPKTSFKGCPSQEEFLVVVANRWSKREEWEYHVDSALNWGTYIDDFWDTTNDWHEGQEVHVVAYMPFPEPLRRPPKGVE